MKKKQYMDKILKQIDGNYPVKCEDCGQTSTISHTIVNHQYNTVKVVCDNCFKDKHMDFIYPEGK